MKTQTLFTASCLLSLACRVVGSTNSSSCGLYLAQSTIPGAGLGMFAGRNYTKGSTVTDGDIIIPILDIDWHNDHAEYKFLWDDYTWSSWSFEGMQDETTSDGVVNGASMGIGAAVNCMDSLVNIDGTFNKIDNAGLHRSRDAGVGAFTPYHDRKSYALADIPAGQELFISYGDSYFPSREETYGLIPLWQDYEVADELLKKYLDQVIPKNHVSQGLLNDLWKIVVESPFPSRTINALPKRASNLHFISKIGTGRQSFNDTIRDLEWLEQHGKCVDNIKPGPSTIPQAGRGAFATRFIPKGGLVTATPLIHLTEKSRLLMYDDASTYDSHIASQPVHRQLLVNYCFGLGANSSLLLSPYGPFSSLINHSRKNPNARIVWSKDMRHPEWLNISVHELDKQDHSGLMIDYIALRDINVGEEITIDYGESWQQAWDAHLQNWKPGSEKYVPAFELRQDDVDSEIRTMYEEPYSTNVQLVVAEYYRAASGCEAQPYDWYTCEILDRYQDNNNKTLYMAQTFRKINGDNTTNMEYDKEILFGLPRDAFSFQDVGYTRDHHLYSSFRHEIMLPDDMIPQAWINQ